MEEKKNKIFRGQLPVSVIYVLLGLCLALMPVETVNVLRAGAHRRRAVSYFSVCV